MSIYTKTGDGGLTSLCGGQRVSKCCQRLESYGAVDELNSHLGLLSTYCNDARDGEFLSLVQRRLFPEIRTSTVIAWKRNIPYSMAVLRFIDEINLYKG